MHVILYIKTYPMFGLIWFYGISIIVDYLMLNPLYIYILNYIRFGDILLMTFLNEPKLIFLHTIKWFQVLLNKCHNLTSVICSHTCK